MNEIRYRWKTIFCPLPVRVFDGIEKLVDGVWIDAPEFVAWP